MFKGFSWPANFVSFRLGILEANLVLGQLRRRCGQRGRGHAGVNIGGERHQGHHARHPRADRQLVLVRDPGPVQTRRGELVTWVGHWPQPRVLGETHVLKYDKWLRLTITGFTLFFLMGTLRCTGGLSSCLECSVGSCLWLEVWGGAMILATAGGGELNWAIGLMGGGG